MPSFVERLRRWFARKPVPLGLRGEQLAARWLKQRGHKIVARGQRSKLGELDLITVDGSTLVFVEVRTRSSQSHGGPVETISPDKQRRVTRAALGYLQRYGLLSQPSRFDVVAITWAADASPLVEHYPNAFEATGPRSMFS
jgi:putative endonuclease